MSPARVCAALCAAATAAAAAGWHDRSLPPAERARQLAANMTLSEQIGLLHGTGWGHDVYVGEAVGVPRLGIPTLKLNDGPQGYRCNGLGKCPGGTSTCFPSGLTIGASFDPAAARAWGTAMGKEFYDKGANVQLGPGMCLARVPRNGRNFEYIAGEDPELGRVLAGEAVKGIQGQGVVANAKHWVLNNQETDRGSISAVVDERTRFEMYYPPFKGAIDAGVGSLMCSYNRINGTYSCENNETLNVDLRDRLGFEGWVMSDWNAAHSTSILEGLDQEMPGSGNMGDKLKDAKYKDAVSRSVQRILAPLFSVGIMDKPNPNTDDNKNVSTAESQAAALDLAKRTAVLVRNDNGLLPLKATALKKIAVIGHDAKNPTVGGGGSGAVNPSYLPSPLDAITALVNAAPGREFWAEAGNCSALDVGVDYWDGGHGKSSSGHSTSPGDCCSQCWAKAGCASFSFQASKSLCWFHPSPPAGQKSNADITSGACPRPPTPAPPAPPPQRVFYAQDEKDGAALAASADVAIVFISTSSSEGGDRKTLGYGGADKMVEAIAAAQPNTIVCAVSPGAVLLPWADKVRAVLLPFMPGQMYGEAVASLLFGDAAPSARLPITIPNKDNEVAFTEAQYPGKNGVAAYSEALEVGYRWYDAHSVTPQYCFGHGLSYTSFEYSGLRAGPTSVSFTLKNSGGAAGSEVPQLYLGYPAAAGEPPKVMRGFQQVVLNPGEQTTVTFPLTERDTSVWDAAAHEWTQTKGAFTAMVGASSCDIRVQAGFTVA